MAFVGVALLIALGLAFGLSADAGQIIGLDPSQSARLIGLVTILLLVAGGLFRQRLKLTQLVGGAAMWCGLLALSVVVYAYRDEIAGIPDRVISELSPGVAVVDAKTGNARFRRTFSGSFKVGATINGAPVRLLFDTGATAVVLTADDARAAGIDFEQLRFTIPVQTANGMGRAALTRLDTITVGAIQRRNIRAFVAEDGALETSLLGMTYLETLSGYAVSKNSLELRD